MLKEGDKIIEFNLSDMTGKKHKLSDYKDKQIILYFYPKDNTPGCTLEAIDFSKNIKTINEKNTVVIGISKDSVSSHEKFINKHNLKIILLSDETVETIKAYDVWKEKNMYGKKFMGVERSTFLINQTGNIIKIWRKVKVKGHVEEVINNL